MEIHSALIGYLYFASHLMSAIGIKQIANFIQVRSIETLHNPAIKSSRRVPGNTRRLPLHNCREHTGLGHVKLLASHVERVGGVDLLAQRSSLQRNSLGYLSMSFHMFTPSTFPWWGRGTICSFINRRCKPLFMFFVFHQIHEPFQGIFFCQILKGPGKMAYLPFPSRCIIFLLLCNNLLHNLLKHVLTVHRHRGVVLPARQLLLSNLRIFNFLPITTLIDGTDTLWRCSGCNVRQEEAT